MIQWGFVQNVDGNTEIFSRLLDHFLKNTNQLSNIEIVLTATELKIFNFFRDNQGVLIDREQLAQIIWGKEFLDLYSDYAIDRHISNLRKKILSNNLNLEISTQKAKGFIANPHG